jgi:hypothetical protein
MTLIESKTLGTAQASIEFTSIPQDGTDLLLLVSARKNQSAGNAYVGINLNGSSTGFSHRALFGDGSTPSYFTNSPATFLGEANFTTATANTFASLAAYFPNYSGSTNKSYSVESVTETNATTSYQNINAGLWSNTAAITTLTLTGLGNFEIGSSASLYKITKGSDGIVTTTP